MRGVRSTLLIVVTLAACSCAQVLGLPGSATHVIDMRDGVGLATDVYLPEEPGPHPTILIRNTYNKDAGKAGLKAMAAFAKPYTEHGYAFVVQDTRGRFSSMGVDSIFLTDGNGPLKDGYDTIEWIIQQDWSNGDVGMFGMSALAITTYMAAASGHPALKAAVVTAGGSNLYDDIFYPGGVFRQHMVDRWVTGQGRAEFLPFIYGHPSYDSVWQRVDLRLHAEKSHTAIYHWGGWYDCMSQGQTRGFKALQERGGEGARGNQVLVMGAWSHGGTGQTQGELRYPRNTHDMNPGSEMMGWFDRFLMPTGADSGHAGLPPVRYYLMGDVADSTGPGNQWLTDETWPPAEMSETTFYLHPDKSLQRMKPNTDATLGYKYDPHDPVPTLGGLNLYKPVGPADLQPIEERSDVLSFSTAPLEEPLAIAGNVRMVLHAGSNCPDTDYMALLTDVYPDGRSMLVTDGAVRARYRSSPEEQFMEPDMVYEFDINLWDTAMLFNRGHRIRIDITSSNSPRFMPNPNTATPFHTDSVGTVAHNEIRIGERYPSALILPTIPTPETPERSEHMTEIVGE
jgi:uncharacterized protein